MTNYRLVKRNSRLMIINDETDEVVYCPPNFITVPNREAFAPLVDAFNSIEARPIDSIVEFEDRHRRAKNR